MDSVQAAYDRDAGPFDEKRGGLGLALPLARRVIEGHGGRMQRPSPLEHPSAAYDPGDPLHEGRLSLLYPLRS